MARGKISSGSAAMRSKVGLRPLAAGWACGNASTIGSSSAAQAAKPGGAAPGACSTKPTSISSASKAASCTSSVASRSCSATSACASRKLLSQQRQRAVGDARHEGQAQLPGPAGRCRLRHTRQLLGLGQQAAHARQQRCTSGAQRHAALRALEQFGTEFALEPLDGQAQWRLRHVQPLRGTAEVQLLGHGDKLAQRAQFDH